MFPSAPDAFCNGDRISEAPCLDAKTKVYVDKATAARNNDRKKCHLRISDVGVNENGIEAAAVEHAVQVLITNLPFSPEHSDEPRRKAGADDVIDLYLSSTRPKPASG